MNDVYAINLAKTEFREGFNTCDVDRIMAVFAPRITDFSDGFPSFFGDEGRTVLLNRLRRLFAACRVRAVVTIIDINVLGDTAIEYGWHEFTISPKGGGEGRVTRERYVDIWRRQPDGAWRIAVYINNADQAAEMPNSQRALESPAWKQFLALA